MKNDLTIAKIKHTDFAELYDKFIIGKKLNQKQYETLLAIAICFTNADDINVQQWGYRIVVEYCNQTQDYMPLYEIAINKGLYPVSKFIERHYIDDDQRNFFTEWNDAFTEQYISGDICRSEQQDALIKFFEKKYNNTISISAPTSYGKSELILSTIKEYKGRKICVLTSTKALLTQTKKRIQQISKGIFPKVVVHPEMYNSKDVSCLAVLTQERLLRVLKKDPALAFDCIIVDEAHEILENNARSRILADVIIVAQKRNPDVAFKFLTPFLADSKNLKIRYTTYDIEGFKVSEYIKTEKYYLYDLKNHTGLKFYDQFLNKFLPISGDENLGFEENVVKKYSAEKNIIYLNKPLDIEKFALDLAAVLPEVKSEIIQRACDNIAEYLQPQYNLITCLRKGIIYHHGSVPDAIRIYIEDLYKENEAIKYVITSSTLLSGVNLPAERMFILDNRRGRSNLSHDSFKNLVGRVCRFNEIFNNDSGTLQRLEPQIYLVFGRYFARNANCENFLCNVAKAEKKYQDEVENVLLSQTKITEVNKEELRHASEFIENYENGAVENYKERYIDTTFGKACIMNGANEIDVFKYENEIQQQVSKYQHENLKINDSTKLLEIINELFIKYLPENGTDSLRRLSNKEARKFYAMMFEWRVENKSYSEMISLFFGYWHQLYRKNRNVMVYVGKWGDVKQEGSNVARYTKFIGKNRTQMLDEALLFVKRNMRTKTIISPTTGRRTDRTDYPITAVREAIINALVHRDYSIHTEGMPIQLIMFEDRIEIHNPGGLYGRITIDQLGKIQPDTRNPVLASALETLGITENRYSGIPTIRMEMEKYNLRQPEFLDERGSFIVKLYKESKNDYEDMSNDEETNNLIVFCKTPRTRKEICDYLGLNSVTYAIQTYVNPLVEAGVIKLSIPDKPKSPKQLYYSVEREE